MSDLGLIESVLASHRKEFSERFGVKRLAVFGSFARGDQKPDSDVDILVEFGSPVGIEFIDLGNYLEHLLGLRVDLVSRNGIKPKYFHKISRDLRYV